eukprot:COSAG01_NODE_14046_length_1502_cov_2.268710_2_plen_61_part_00
MRAETARQEHTRFIKDLLQEIQLRRKITQLQGYRRLGMRTHAEIEQYHLRHLSTRNGFLE